jgi:prepilin-type N-terminal cleavage/methylation domain-containing protein
MKLSVLSRPQGRRHSGFTLVELLIVISLIAVLAGVSVPVYNSINKRMREQQARVMAIQIQNAVKNYYTEYMKYPAGDGGSEATAMKTDQLLVNVLLGKDETLNPRGIKFLPEFKDASDSGKNGLVTSEGSARVVDPWGEEFNVLMDLGDYNNEIENPDVESSSKILNMSVACYSGGEDKDPETWEDNIASWATSVRGEKKE